MKVKNVTSFVRRYLPCALVLLAAQQSVEAQETLRLQNASLEYDVEVQVKACGGAERYNIAEVCDGPGRVSLYRKGGKTPLQVLSLPNIWINKRNVAHSPKINEKPRMLYEEEYGIVFDDFNFDGREDLAVCNGRNGGYGGPSYTVFLFDKRSGRLIESRELSRLNEGTYLGLFFPDPKKKLLRAYWKDGCCYHETEVYKVVNNRPVLVERISEDASASDEKTMRVTVTTRRLVKGKWVKTVRREKRKQEKESDDEN
jgi:hypothetical protein